MNLCKTLMTKSLYMNLWYSERKYTTCDIDFSTCTTVKKAQNILTLFSFFIKKHFANFKLLSSVLIAMKVFFILSRFLLSFLDIWILIKRSSWPNFDRSNLNALLCAEDQPLKL